MNGGSHGCFDRRSFLHGAAATTGGVLVSGPLQALVASTAQARPPHDKFLTLGDVADLRDGRVRLQLPPGFQYRSFHDTDGSPVVLSDGTVLPGRHDGMAAFPGPGGNVWLVRNHEVNGSALDGAFGPLTPYDSSALGGTTTSLVTPFGEVLESFTSLNGSQMNCAGGGMPWGSWMSCEETVNGPDVYDDFTRNIPSPSPPDTYIQNARLFSRTASSSRSPPVDSRTASRSRVLAASPTRLPPTAPTRGSSTSPRTISLSRRGSSATSRRPTRCRSATSTTVESSRCSRSSA